MGRSHCFNQRPVRSIQNPGSEGIAKLGGMKVLLTFCNLEEAMQVFFSFFRCLTMQVVKNLNFELNQQFVSLE